MNIEALILHDKQEFSVENKFDKMDLFDIIKELRKPTIIQDSKTGLINVFGEVTTNIYGPESVDTTYILRDNGDGTITGGHTGSEYSTTIEKVFGDNHSYNYSSVQEIKQKLGLI
jgi:hypothetical protein